MSTSKHSKFTGDVRRVHLFGGTEAGSNLMETTLSSDHFLRLMYLKNFQLQFLDGFSRMQNTSVSRCRDLFLAFHGDILSQEESLDGLQFSLDHLMNSGVFFFYT